MYGKVWVHRVGRVWSVCCLQGLVVKIHVMCVALSLCVLLCVVAVCGSLRSTVSNVDRSPQKWVSRILATTQERDYWNAYEPKPSPWNHSSLPLENCTSQLGKLVNEAMSRVLTPILSGGLRPPPDVLLGCNSTLQQSQSTEFQLLWNALNPGQRLAPVDPHVEICGNTTWRSVVSCSHNCIVGVYFSPSSQVPNLSGTINTSTIGLSILRTLGVLDISSNAAVKVDLIDLLNAAPLVLRFIDAYGAQIVGGHKQLSESITEIALVALITDGSGQYNLPSGPAVINLELIVQYDSAFNSDEAFNSYFNTSAGLSVVISQHRGLSQITSNICRAGNLSMLSTMNWDGDTAGVRSCSHGTLGRLVYWNIQQVCANNPCIDFTEAVAAALSGHGENEDPFILLAGGAGLRGPLFLPRRALVLDLSGTSITTISPPLSNFTGLCSISTRSTATLIFAHPIKGSFPALQSLDLSDAFFIAGVELHDVASLTNFRICDTLVPSVKLTGVSVLSKFSVANSGVQLLSVIPADGARALPTLTSLWIGGAPLNDGLAAFPAAPNLQALIIADDANVSGTILFGMMTAAAENLVMVAAAGSSFCGDPSAQTIQRDIVTLLSRMPNLASIDISDVQCWTEQLFMANFSVYDGWNGGIAYISTPGTILPIVITQETSTYYTHESAFVVLCRDRVKEVFGQCGYKFVLSKLNVSIVPGNSTASTIYLNARYNGLANIWANLLCAAWQDMPALVAPDQVVVLNITQNRDMVDVVSITVSTAGFAVDLSTLKLREHLRYDEPTRLHFDVRSFADEGTSLLTQGLVRTNVTVTLLACADKREYAVRHSNRCEPCPTEGACDGTDVVHKVATANVYCWLDEAEVWHCDKCDDQLKNCESGDVTIPCAAGYTGGWCLDCAVGYGRSYKNRACLQCPHDDYGVPYILFGVEMMIALGLMTFALVAAHPPGTKKSLPNLSIVQVKLLWQSIMVRGFPLVVSLTVYQRARIELTTNEYAHPNPAARGTTAVVAMFTTVSNLVDCTARKANLSAEYRLWLPLALAVVVWCTVYLAGTALLFLKVRDGSATVTLRSRCALLIQSVTSIAASCTPYMVNQLGSITMNGRTVFAAEPELAVTSHAWVAVATAGVVLGSWVTLFGLLSRTLWQSVDNRRAVRASVPFAELALSHLTWWPQYSNAPVEGLETNPMETTAQPLIDEPAYHALPNRALVVDSLLNIGVACSSAALVSDVRSAAALVLLVLTLSKFATVPWIHRKLDRTNWEHYRDSRKLGDDPLDDAQRRHLSRVLVFEQHMERLGRWSKEFAVVCCALALLQRSVHDNSGFVHFTDCLITTMIAAYIAASLAIVFQCNRVTLTNSSKQDDQLFAVSAFYERLGSSASGIGRPHHVVLHLPSLIGVLLVWVCNVLYVAFITPETTHRDAFAAVITAINVSAVLLVLGGIGGCGTILNTVARFVNRGGAFLTSNRTEGGEPSQVESVAAVPQGTCRNEIAADGNDRINYLGGEGGTTTMDS